MYEEEFDIRSTGPILQRRIRCLLNICVLHFTLLFNNFLQDPLFMHTNPNVSGPWTCLQSCVW